MNNLSLKDFFLSYFPETIVLSHIDFRFYKELYKDRIEPDTAIRNNAYFILIKPEGLHHELEITKILGTKGFSVSEQYVLQDYVRLEISLYNYPDIQDIDCSDRGIEMLRDRALLLSCLWLEADKIRCPGAYDIAKVLILHGKDFSKIKSIKIFIRKKIGHIRFYRIRYGSLSDTVFSSYIHVPDEKNRVREYSILRKFLARSFPATDREL